MTKKFIGQMFEEMREASENHQVNTVRDTAMDITEVAAKQIIRKMRVNGLGSLDMRERNKRQTANRILPEAEDRYESKKCPPGYIFDKKQLRCVPVNPKNQYGSGDKDSKPSNSPQYNVWGNTGYGSGYAWEEPGTANDTADNGYGGSDGMSEEKDACYHKVKARYDVFPSAYASGAIVQCRKKGAKNWGKTAKQVKEEQAIRRGEKMAANLSVDMGWDDLSERKRASAMDEVDKRIKRKNRIKKDVNSETANAAFSRFSDFMTYAKEQDKTNMNDAQLGSRIRSGM